MSRQKKGERKRYVFSKADCQKGYQVTLAKCMADWKLLEWFVQKKIRGFYRHKKETSDGQSAHAQAHDQRDARVPHDESDIPY